MTNKRKNQAMKILYAGYTPRGRLVLARPTRRECRNEMEWEFGKYWSVLAKDGFYTQKMSVLPLSNAAGTTTQIFKAVTCEPTQQEANDATVQ